MKQGLLVAVADQIGLRMRYSHARRRGVRRSAIETHHAKPYIGIDHAGVETSTFTWVQEMSFR